MERTVRAKADGMKPDGGHIRQGASFIIDEGEFAPSWMEPVGWTPPESPKPETAADMRAADAARIAELADQVEAEKARTAEVVEKAQAAIDARDAEIAELKAALAEALTPKAVPEPPKAEPEPDAAKTATKTK